MLPDGFLGAFEQLGSSLFLGPSEIIPRYRVSRVAFTRYFAMNTYDTMKYSRIGGQRFSKSFHPGNIPEIFLFRQIGARKSVNLILDPRVNAAGGVAARISLG